MYLITAKEKDLEEHLEIAKKYHIGLEVDDFFEPAVYEDNAKVDQLIELYKATGLMDKSTMHGAFYDVIPFSLDRSIRELSLQRMKQSMEIAKRLGVKAVVFHTNYEPALRNEQYTRRVIEKMVSSLELLLQEYSTLHIYLENMLDDTPDILEEISKRLSDYDNYGICLDWAHVNIYSVLRKEWIDRLSEWIRHLHVNDNDILTDAHLAVGCGKIDWMELKTYLQKNLHPDTIVIETGQPKDQIYSLEYLQKLLNE